MTVALSSVRIAGLTSIDDLTLDLTTPVTVLIGSNGAGKSNVVGALDLLGRIIDHQLQSYVAQRGGFSNLLHRSPRRGRSVDQVHLEVRGDDDQADIVGYQATVGSARGDEAIVYETIYEMPSTRGEASEQQRDSISLGNARESRLQITADESTSLEADLAQRLLPLLTGCRVFHFHDTSSDAPVKRRVDDADNLTLAPDARNIAPLLARLGKEAPALYRRIVRTVQSVAPFFEDFVLEPESGRLRLRWREKGLGYVFSADELSDGTLRFICLATLLLQPDRPSTVVLDEPELGLHPFAINQLAGLIRSASSDGGKIVLATQSVTLLGHFEPTELAVVERGTSGTTVSRLDVDALADWLAEYSVGELWEKNVLGGRPRPDSPASPQGIMGR
jgi:predicted ATPase